MKETTIFGPPGTGKTTYLIDLVKDHLIGGVTPRNIAFMSFSKKAATEAKTRALRDLDLDHLYNVYNDYYKDSQFVKIINQAYPKLSEVNATNDCLISLFSSSERNDDSNLVIMSAIDNLMKGASGQAVQNMNIMFGLKESTGLV